MRWLLVILSLAACTPATVTIGDAAHVTITQDPLSVTIDDAFGRRVLHMRGILAAHDAFGEVTQILPGWDGYVEGVTEHLLFTRGVLQSGTTDSLAELDL